MKIEDEMIINGHWSINAGINASLFSIHGKTFTNINPRFALKYQPFTNLSFKASYTSMTQYVHKISNSFLELPTDYWVPTTEILHPMNSWQLTAGAYFQPHNKLSQSNLKSHPRTNNQKFDNLAISLLYKYFF